MRIGKLVVTKKVTFKVGDKCFDTVSKQNVEIKKMDGRGIWMQDEYGNPHKGDAESLVDISVKDTVEETLFVLGNDQKAYMYRSESKENFRFLTYTDFSNNEEETAVIIAKTIKLRSHVRFLSGIVDAYGMYVASQKAIKEPAKKFEDWFFNISI
tara:strand:+ start:377 stop:841 length:465 start_codon:yes stop_codon:yes gene_type:complete